MDLGVEGFNQGEQLKQDKDGFSLGTQCTLLKKQNKNAYAMTFFLKIQNIPKIPFNCVLITTLRVGQVMMQMYVQGSYIYGHKSFYGNVQSLEKQNIFKG